MPRTLVAGLDGSPESLAAADWAAREALLRDLPLRLIHAWYEPQPWGSAGPEQAEAQRHWALRIPREAEAELVRRHPGLRVGTEQVSREPVAALLDAARDAELLALGSRGLSGFGGFLVGSVALAVVARMEQPTVLVRAGRSAQGEHGGNVLLGLDVDHAGDAVLAFAFEEAARHSTGLRVVASRVIPPYYYGFGGVSAYPEFKAEQEAQVQRKLTALLEPWEVKYPHVGVERSVPVGQAGIHLVDDAREACLVVVGRRTRRVAVGPRIGSVAHAVLHHATAPVAVVPHG
jgi:nucleotide-binding universal stress UspA family protein